MTACTKDLKLAVKLFYQLAQKGISTDTLVFVLVRIGGKAELERAKAYLDKVEINCSSRLNVVNDQQIPHHPRLTAGICPQKNLDALLIKVLHEVQNPHSRVVQLHSYQPIRYHANQIQIIHVYHWGLWLHVVHQNIQNNPHF